MDDILVQAMQKKHDQADRAMDVFREMHRLMHEEEKPPIVRTETSPVPS